MVFDPVAELYSRYPYPPAEPGSRAWKREINRRSEEGRFIAQTLLSRRPALENGSLLDAGCGTGQKLLGLAQALPDATIVGGDCSPASLAIGRRLLKDAGHERVRLVRLDLSKSLPAEASGPFDAVVCDGVLHHLEDPARGLSNLGRVLKPGGEIWMTVFGKLGRAEMARLRKMLTILEPRFLRFDRRLSIARMLVKVTGILPKRRARRFQNDSSLADAALIPRETHFDVVEAVRFLERGGFDRIRWVDGEPLWEAFLEKAGAAAREIDDELLGRELSPVDRWRIVELWKRPGMLRFMARKVETPGGERGEGANAT